MNEATSDQLHALTKVMLSMNYSLSDINEVRALLKKSTLATQLLLEMVYVIGNDTSVFNSFVSGFKKAGILPTRDELEEGYTSVKEYVVYSNKDFKIVKDKVSFDVATKLAARKREYKIASVGYYVDHIKGKIRESVNEEVLTEANLIKLKNENSSIKEGTQLARILNKLNEN